jgi:hypothetical protein
MITCEKYAQGVHHFLSAGLYRGARVNCRKRKLIGIRHSLGGVAMYIHHVPVVLPRNSFHCLRTILQELDPIIPFSSIVLIEPMLSPARPEYFYDLRRILLEKAYERRDVWLDREQALVALKTRRTARWHPRVLDLYVVRS